VNYISSDEIVNDVKNRMQTYFASNRVDESILPRVLRKCVGQMGLKIYPPKRAVLDVCNYKADLPEGFKFMTLAMMCSGRSVYVKNPFKVRQGQVVCETACEYTCATNINAYNKFCAMTDECGNILRLVETTEFDRFETNEFSVLKASAGCKPYCTNGCLNFHTKCSYEFDIKESSQSKSGKILQTNFCDGRVYIEYLSDLEYEDYFDIPDNETVKDWIFEECRREIYTYLWDNGEEVMQRMQHSERELFIKQERARQVYSRRSVQEHYDTTNRLVRRFKSMESLMSPRTGVYCPTLIHSNQ
jgi:hypothetical protein